MRNHYKYLKIYQIYLVISQISYTFALLKDNTNLQNISLMQVTDTKIIVDHGIKQKIKQLTGVSYPTIAKALRGQCKDNILTRSIRQAALELGGVEIPNEN